MDTFASLSWNNVSGWILWPGAFSSPSQPPDNSSVSWTFAAGNGRPVETISRQWYINLPTTAFTNTKDYISKFCNAGGSNIVDEEAGESSVPLHNANPTNSNTGGTASGPNTGSNGNNHAEDFTQNTNTNPGNQPDPNAEILINATLPVPVVQGEALAMFQLDGFPNVCIFMVTTLAITGEKDTWRTTFSQMLDKFQSLKCQKLILDLTGNGGGYLDLAWEIIAVLTPNPAPAWPMQWKRYKRDFRLGSLASTMVQTAFANQSLGSEFEPEWFGDEPVQHEFRDLSLVSSTRNKSFTAPNGTKFTQAYSSYYVELPVAIGSNDPLKGRNLNLTNKDIVLLSSGDCGSACGLIYYSLHERDGVNAAVYGMLYNRSRTFAAFPVTEVYTHAQIAAEAKLLGLSGNPMAPQQFNISAEVRTPMREGYSFLDSNAVLEYRWTDANIHVDSYPRFLLRPDQIWQGSAEAMGWVQVPSQYKGTQETVMAVVSPPPPPQPSPSPPTKR